jgi:hypothetical protein
MLLSLKMMLLTVESRGYSLSEIVPLVRMVHEDMHNLFHILQTGS